MREMYCSFEGKLDLSNQSGYVIYEMENNMLQIEFLSVDNNVKNEKIRIPSSILSIDDFSDDEKICNLCVDVSDGLISGAQYFYREKWWGSESINKIQNEHQDGNWKRYIR